MTYFTPVIDDYFASWIRQDTWDTMHPFDEERFHRFVMALHRYSKDVLVGARKCRNPRTDDPRRLEEKIATGIMRNHPHAHHDLVQEFAAEHARRAIIILDFLRTVDRTFPNGYVRNLRNRLK